MNIDGEVALILIYKYDSMNSLLKFINSSTSTNLYRREIGTVENLSLLQVPKLCSLFIYKYLTNFVF